MNILVLVIEEFDKAYKEYSEYAKRGRWGDVYASKSYLFGVLRCMQIIFDNGNDIPKEMGEEVFKRTELLTKVNSKEKSN